MGNLIISKHEYNNDTALGNVVNYVMNENKSFGVSGGQGVLLNNPHTYMELVKTYYCQDGKQVQHFWLTFGRDEYITVSDAYSIGYAVCSLFPEYQMVFSLHQNTEHLHIHWAMNPVSIITGKKFNFGFKESFELRRQIGDILKDYGCCCNLRMPSESIK